QRWRVTGTLGSGDSVTERRGHGACPGSWDRSSEGTPEGSAMLTIGGTTRVFLAVQPVDLRGSFDRLYGYVSEVLREDPRSGHWFVFTNKRKTRIKILVFDGTGLWVLNKRL